MGWNAGYRMFEATVIAVYNTGKLDKPLLTALMEPYRDTDIDSGGSRDLKTHDGKGLQQVMIETWGLAMPTKPEGEYDENPDAWDAYETQVCDLMEAITDQFGWW